MKISKIARAIAAAVAVLASTPAFAHVGAAGHAHGFAAGFMHPMSGLDHLLVMVAVGLLAANLGSRALWMVPAAFILMMAGGGALGVFQMAMPFVEIGIATSVIVLGALVAMRLTLSTVTAMAIVAVFAVFHGYAHGSEMPVNVSAGTFAAGFLLATALLHSAGIAIGLGICDRANRFSATHLSKLIGTAISVTGAGLLTGWL